ncbi:hypothetical protein C6I20_04670 [Aeromicrobium sp. A1-2]|uniref:DUF1761 domain-containing protein n=1 Tax=Aeromicrobium sp. A1-2 TaxID=2107713 RepID=UPI000E5154BA|nr:DUF1761 domain-containing protein [Aeromicrobium sp. A1-2]AXT84559.1 hypothetical protein C6I20_04670 [Aeromicrobium sp. A1-2]
MDDLSLVGIIVAALAFFFLGAAWYSFLFRKPWADDMGYTKDMPGNPQSPGAGLLIGSLVAALVLALSTAWLVGAGGAGEGAKVGLAIGAVSAAIMGQNALYDNRPTRLWLINAGYAFVGAIMVGVICGAFQG